MKIFVLMMVKIMMDMVMAIHDDDGVDDDGDDDADDNNEGEDGNDKDDGDDLMMERFEAARSAAEESSIHINGQGSGALGGACPPLTQTAGALGRPWGAPEGGQGRPKIGQ